MRNIITAFLLGVRDGWGQPHELRSSTNVEHLMAPGSDEDHVLEWQDRGINIGQLARAGRDSQAYRERYWPLKPRRSA